MPSLHRLLLPCPSQNCSAETTPSPPLLASEGHVAMSTNMTVMACTLGLFFLGAILCAVARLLYLKRLESRRRRDLLNRAVRFDFSGEEVGPAVDHPFWLMNFVGLSQSAIDSIAICKYRKGEGLVEGTECSVCLGEFEEDEDVRLLPKCGHAFHAPCIDTWLRSHKNCPLCRAPVVVVVGNVVEPVRMETVVEGSEAESEVENWSRENRVGEGGSGDEIEMGFGGVTTPIVDGEIGGNSKNYDSREIRGLGSERELDRLNRVGEGGSSAKVDMGFGYDTSNDDEFGRNSKNFSYREIRIFATETDLDHHNRVGEGGSGAEIDMGFGDVTMVEGEIGGNSKNCDSREIRGLGTEREFDRLNRVGEGDFGSEIDMGFGDVTPLDEIGGNSKNCLSREIRGLVSETKLDRQNQVGGNGNGSRAEIDLNFGDVTQIDDEIGRNWKFCNFQVTSDLDDNVMDLDHQNRVCGDSSGAEIDMSFGSNAQIDDEIGRNSKILNSRSFGNLIGIKPMKRSLSMGSDSSKLGKMKRHSFKNNGDDDNGNSSFFGLIRSASSGRLSNLSNLLMMKRCNSGSSGNFRSQDLILPM